MNPPVSSGTTVTPVSTPETHEGILTPQETTFSISEWLAAITGFYLPSNEDIVNSWWIYALIALVIAVAAINFFLFLKNKKYLFCWDEIPGNDTDKFMEYLEQNYGISWAGKDNIEKIDDNRIISSSGNNSITLSLNDERTKAILMIDDSKTGELKAKMHKGKLNIYK